MVWAHGPLQWCHQPFKWHTPGRLRHREGGLELGWAHERERERWKIQPEDLSCSPWEGVVAMGSSGSWSRQLCWRAKLNNHSFLTSAEAAPSGEVLGIGYSICPRRVWLNWRYMELLFFFFLFLTEVNSCLTILPSDVASRELGKQTTALGMRLEDCVAAAMIPTFTPVSVEEVGSSITHQSYAMTCCFLISWNVPGEKVLSACARFCSFLLFT